MNMARWLIGLGFFFILGTIISNILQGVYYGAEDLYFVQAINHFQMAFSNIISWSAGLNMLSGAADMLRAIVQFVTWDYSFFYGAWEMFRYFLIAISFGFMFAAALTIASSLKWI